MHYYQWHIGDYRRDTSHLTMLEHGAYRQLLDSYYLTESPLPSEECDLMRSHCARSADEMQAVRNVLKDFFTLTDKGWVHHRCEKELKGLYDKSESARASANLRWQREKERKQAAENAAKEIDANALRTQSDGNATQLPINPLTQLPKSASDDADIAESGKPPPAVKTPKASFDYSTGRIENLSAEIVQSWQEAYPAIDIRMEVAKAKAWLLANPKNRKSNIEKFLTNWLTRAQDHAPRIDRDEKARIVAPASFAMRHADKAWADGL